MVNYYEILGLDTGAGLLEIKAAFRQLAKMYHPDVNPQGKDRFTTILKAYEVLSDPNKKYSYDYKLNSRRKQESQAEQKIKTTKSWRFDERELKRRKYYDEHLKKYEKRHFTASSETEPKAGYNEFKYILFATPLAVALFLGIMTYASKRKESARVEVSTVQPEVEKKSDLRMGDSPYAWFFGSGRFDTIHNGQLIVKNLTGKDVVICLFTGTDFVRSFYIEDSYSAEVSQLPAEPLEIRYASGYYFDKLLHRRNAKAEGAFSRDEKLFVSEKPISLQAVNELTLLADNTNPGFRASNEKEFFKNKE